MVGDWCEISVGDFAPFIYGKSLPETHRNTQGNVPVYGSNGVVGFHDASLTRGSTVIIGRKGTVGAVHYSSVACWPIDTTFYISGLDTSQIRYRYYVLKSLGLEHMNTDSAVPGLNRDAAHARRICVPTSENEQHAIAHILGTLDDKIELNRRMNETLEAMARVLFKSWFVDFDPVRAKAEGRDTGLPKDIADLFPDSFEDSELGEIPRGWEVHPFTALVEVIGGGTPKTSISEYWGGDIPWFSVVDAPVESDVFVLMTAKSITEKGLDSSSTVVLPEGTTIISARGTVGKVALVGVPMAMNQSCYGLRGKEIGVGFVYFLTRNLVSSFIQRGHGSVFNTITRDTLNSVSFVASPKPVLDEYEKTIAPLLQRIKSNGHESNTLAATRDALLPKLISGEIRVKARAA